MLFRLPVATDIITIPDRFAKLEQVAGEEGSRDFEYKFKFKVDITKALRADSLFLDVWLLDKKPEKPKVKPPSIMPAKFRTSTKILEKKSQKNQRSIFDSLFAFLRTEITDVIPNTTAKEISAGKKTFSRPVKREPVPVINPSTYQTPVKSTIPRSKKVSLTRISKAFIKTQRDPAQLVSFRNSPPAALSFLQPIEAMLAKNVMFRERKEQVVPVPTIYTVFLGTAQLSRNMILSEKKLKSRSTFYLQAKLRNDKGVVIAEAGTIVPHAKILNDFLTPIEPPQLLVSQISVGELSIGISQVDEKATRVKLFRRIAPSENSPGTGWEIILDEDLDKVDGEIRFRDKVASFSPIMYRAVCLGENSRPAERFTSGVITPRQEIKQDFSGKGTATAKIEGTQITVSVTDFPKDAVSVGVRRYDLTQNSYANFQAQQTAGFFPIGSSVDAQRQFITDTSDVIDFVDLPKQGSMYKYLPVTYTLYGKEVLGKAAIIDYVSSDEDNQKVAMTVGSAQFTSGETDHSVSFTLSGKFTDFGFEEISSVLSEANQAGLFGGDISNNRSDFSSLIVFLIERENTRTGEVETFGIQDSATFSDTGTTREASNVKRLEEGTRYLYKVIACIRPAESLFPDLAVAEVDLTTLTAYSRSIQKFRGPLQLRKSTLASTARQKDRSVPSALEPIDPFVAGRTAVQTVVEVVIPASSMKGSSATVERRMDNNLIKWAYTGDMSQLDHFQIFLTSGGGFELLGTLHADFSSMNFSFRHFVDLEIPYDANYSYEIKPINISFVEKESIKTASVIVNIFGGISKTELRNATKVIQR